MGYHSAGDIVPSGDNRLTKKNVRAVRTPKTPVVKTLKRGASGSIRKK